MVSKASPGRPSFRCCVSHRTRWFRHAAVKQEESVATLRSRGALAVINGVGLYGEIKQNLLGKETK